MNARWGSLCLLVAALAAIGCGSSNSSNATLTISPTSATVLLGTSLQFVPNEAGSSNAITWSVNGVANGNATVGTISSTGLYTAPATRPVQASPVPVPIIFAAANTSVPGSGITGSVIELQSGFDFTNFSPGNTINISNNSVAGWNGSFIIEAAGVLQNGNLGVQIATPAGPPANGVGGTATAIPNITITAQVQNTNAIASATITLDSGIRVAFAQPSCSIGTGETFLFASLVSVSGTSNQAVSWTLSGAGSIDLNSGLYTAPSTTGTATITATSLADPTESASATITVVSAADPTLASVSPSTGAIGAAFENVYLSGSNFICTTAVFVSNGATNVALPVGSVSSLSSSSLLVVLPSSVLSTLPSSGSTVTLTFTVERQNGSPQQCSPSPCVVTLSPVRPAIVGITPDSVRQPSSGTFNVTLDGGYFGTTRTAANVTGTPVVNFQINGQAIAAPTFASDRQVVMAVPAGNVSGGPGLYPITATNKTLGSANGSMAAVNFSVQPSLSSALVPTSIAVGAAPASIAINTATGTAIVADQNSNDIALIDLTQSPPVVKGFICTGTVGAVLNVTETPCATASSPVSVSVDNIRNLALVANNASPTPTLAVVDLTAQRVTALLSFPSADSSGNAFPLGPVAVGINPTTGRALVAFTTLNGTNGSNVGAVLDLTQSPPALVTVANINNGPKPRIAVSARLNWALATPGGAGSLSIVDLSRQTTNAITSVARINASTVSANTSAVPSLQVGQPVLISGVGDPSFDGIFPVTAVSSAGFQYAQQGASGASSSGGTASYANPVATLATPANVRGVSINDETQKALLVDFNGNVPGFVFGILDQTSTSVNALSPATSNTATAMNPLTNVGVIVNSVSNQAFIIDPSVPTVITSATFATGSSPVDVAIDPATNTALIVNHGSNSVSFVSLGGTLRSGSPQIIQTSFSPVSAPLQTSSQVTITSSLGSQAASPDQNVILIGSFTASSVPRLDGDSTLITKTGLFPAGCGSAPNICRVMTATISGATLANNGPRYYAIDVQDSGPTFSNVAHLQVIQAVNLISRCPNPSPQGVAIDAVRNVALVTEPGTPSQPCGNVAMVSLSSSNGFTVGTGFGGAPELAVGTNPQGAAVYPQAGLAVVANSASNNVSIVDIVNDGVPATFTTDPLPTGVAVDLGKGNAVVTANGASVVDLFPVTTTAQTPTTIGVQSAPSGVAIDQVNHVAVVANTSSNTASVLNLSSNSATNTSGSISSPQGVAFDPISGNFLITSSATNQVVALDPNSVSSTAIRVGIDPSSIAYNFESGTMITANNLSQTITVVDFINRTVRGVFSLRSSTQFAVDIHPQTNLAVVADTPDNQLLLVPLPY